VDASAVHRRIATLEASLRTRLFSRSPRGYALTSTGQDLLPYAAAIDDQAAAARRKLAASDESLTGTVRVSATEDLADVLAPIVASFRDKHPGVGVTLDMANAFVDLARQHADVAVRISSRPPEGDLIAKHVARLGLAFYGSRAYFARHGRPRRVEDLRDHAVVRGDVSGRFMGDAEEQLERLPFAVSDTNVNIWLVIHVDLRQNARVRAPSPSTRTPRCWPSAPSSRDKPTRQDPPLENAGSAKGSAWPIRAGRRGLVHRRWTSPSR
jgi:DNA-binding transcriptional LysR family regulator